MPTPNDDYLTRREHDEFVKRMEEKTERHEKRIDSLEETVKDIGRLATSIEKIATNQDYMIKEQNRQGELLNKAQAKIESLEKEPLVATKESVDNAKKKAIETIITVVVTALVVGAIAIIATYAGK